MAKPKTCVIIVGAGGIGSALYQDLCRFLAHDIDIHLLDGDSVEGKNVQRQMFSKKHLGRNKAQCLVETASTALGRSGLYFHGQYLESPEQLKQMARHYAKVILVGAVDNHPARRVMEAFASDWMDHEYHERDVYYVDCANGENKGEVVAVYADGPTELRGTLRSGFDQTVLTDTSGDPTKASCNQQLDAGNIQTLFTNRKAAIIALELIGAFLNGDIRTGIIYFRECTTARLKAV